MWSNEAHFTEEKNRGWEQSSHVARKSQSRDWEPVQLRIPSADVPSTVFSTEGPHDSKADRPHVLVELTVYRLCPVASSAMWGQTDDCARLPGSSTRCRL